MTRDEELHEARKHLREAHTQIMQARYFLKKHEVEKSLAALAHVEPWLATARREIHYFQRTAAGLDQHGG